jgi:Ser/Thr protein kinase RdoA (MazF antagonist)
LGEIFAWLHDAVFEARWTNEGLARRTWCEESVVRDFHILVPGSEEIVHRAFDRVRSEIEALPRSRESYGLIHADLNQANFLLGSPGLKIFDFDDACFSWFAYDLIVPFYHFPKDRLAGASAAFRSLVRGYERVREFERDWLESFPLFFQWRDLITYAFFYEQLEIANLPPRLRATFLGMRERIEAGRPIAELGGAG